MAKKYYRKANKYGLGDALSSAWKNAFSSDIIDKSLSSGLGAAGTLLGLGASSLIGGGRSSGVGNTIGNIGGTIGGALSNVNPVLGGVVSLGAGVIGGAVNNLIGSKINQERVNQANLEIGSALGFNTNAGDFDVLLSEANNAPIIQSFSRSDIGSDGAFSNKAKKLYLELKQKQEIADQWVASSIENNALNIAENRLNLQLAGYYALGGNLFSDGGGIHIKPSKRGTFTAAAKKHGKSVQAFASLVLANKENYSPAMVKKANFARNFGGRKRAYGGELTPKERLNVALGRTPNGRPLELGLINVYPELILNPKSLGGVASNALENMGLSFGKKATVKTLRGLVNGTKFLLRVEDKIDNTVYGTLNSARDKAIKSTPQYELSILDATKRVKTIYRNSKKANIFPSLLLNDNFSSEPTNEYSFGGVFNTHGGIFSNGTNIIGNGGTHEENPYEGVLIGMDLEGIPNLVEQGELIWNDYVFSDRLNVPKAVRLKYKLRGNKDLTFAEAAKKILKESEERPNDPISKNGLEAGLSSLMMEQEIMKLEQQGNKYSRGGRLYDGTLPYPNLLKFDEKPFTSNVLKYSVPLLSAQIGIANAKADLFLNKLLGFRTKENTDTTENTDTPVKDNWMRLAPIAGSAAGLGYTLFSRPDYTGAENIRRAANEIANVLKVGYTPIEEYLTYKPFDTDYYITKLLALAGANRRALANQAGGNRAAATASLLASDLDTIGKIGDLARQAEEFNLAQDQLVSAFNRATKLASAEMGLKAAMANLEALMKARQARLSGISSAEAMRDTIDLRRSAALSAGITGLFDNLGSAGKEKLMMDIVNNNPALLYNFFGNYKNKSSKGGKLNLKRGGFIY